MDSSRRAVESYWRSRMIDAATSDEDKVAPVYKLEEICQLLRSSHVSIVKEISEFILKRLEHKSPIVKQKALRLIKYAVGKSGVEFRREMQRHSVAVRQLFHYKGQLDPLKGDALNKAVRDTAHETILAIFAEEESKPAPAEDLNKRIQGFGNTNFEMLSEDKKSFLSEVVGLGSASIKQGLSSITAVHSLNKNDNGSYRSPNLRRSLTTERDDPDKYERFEHSDTRASSGISKNLSGGSWGQDSGGNVKEVIHSSGSSYSGSKTREERLLETIVTSGGVRLQPTRDAIQAFLVDASKLDAISMSHALESKLRSPVWQVRMKAVCVLDSVLRKKDEANFSDIAIYFSENKDSVVGCSESPQASLREKANKVLSLLDGEQSVLADHLSEKSSSMKDKNSTIVQMPDLIDTGDVNESYGKDHFTEKHSDQGIADLMTSTTPITDDLFGDGLIDERPALQKNEENDLFAGVSFHTADDGEHVSDLFSGLHVDDKHVIDDTGLTENKKKSELLDIFGPSAGVLHEHVSHKKENDMLAGFPVSKGNTPDNKQQYRFPETVSDAAFLNPNIQSSHLLPNDGQNGLIGSQMVGNPNAMFALGPLQYGMPPNMMFNPAFASQPMNYNMMGNYIAQQQLLATMPNFQQLQNLSSVGNVAVGHVPGNSREGGYPSALPDIFHPNVPTQAQSTLMSNSKKEDTKAFDFISDHLSSARGAKKVL